MAQLYKFVKKIEPVESVPATIPVKTRGPLGTDLFRDIAVGAYRPAGLVVN